MEYQFCQTVMLVDDNSVDNIISKRLIEITRTAQEIITKNSVRDALNYLKDNKNNKDKIPSLIFLDIIMPQADGFIFLNEFENMPHLVKEKAKIVVLSCTENQQDLNKITNNDLIHRFIPKPLTDTRLYEIAESCIPQSLFIQIKGYHMVQ